MKVQDYGYCCKEGVTIHLNYGFSEYELHASMCHIWGNCKLCGVQVTNSNITHSDKDGSYCDNHWGKPDYRVTNSPVMSARLSISEGILHGIKTYLVGFKIVEYLATMDKEEFISLGYFSKLEIAYDVGLDCIEAIL